MTAKNMSRIPLALLGIGIAIGILGGVSVRATGNLEVITLAGTAIGNRTWSANSFPILWNYNDPTTVVGCNYSSANAPAGTLQAANAAGFTTWQNLPDSKLTFSYGGTTAVRNVGTDGVNVITFCDAGVLASNLGFVAQTPSTALTTSFTVVAGGGCPAGQGVMDLNGAAAPPPF